MREYLARQIMIMLLYCLQYGNNCAWLCTMAVNYRIYHSEVEWGLHCLSFLLNDYTGILLISISLKITDFYLFAHLFKTFCKLFNKLHLYCEIDRQIAVLVGRINGLAYEEVYIRRVLKQHSRYAARPVLLIAPFLCFIL